MVLGFKVRVRVKVLGLGLGLELPPRLHVSRVAVTFICSHLSSAT